MELKKTHKADLENKRVLFLQIGVFVALSLVLLVMEWNTGKQTDMESLTILPVALAENVNYGKLQYENQIIFNIKKMEYPEISNLTAEEFFITQQSAEFPGGVSKLKSFITKEIETVNNYEKNEKIYASVSVSAQGKIRNILLLAGTDKQLQQAGMKILAKMPDWKPATLHNRAVNSRLVIPLTFQNY